ncbi:hypothetical protein ASG29_04745 [Sphingomonas sp. Leaf412]|uniref:S24 family peptidase n=1 Tax=Sphingomonas sp. Leaf412 TaxID=1736370 RepID=UPI000702209B|nr:S24 family peptidase [Sphingomonas sp. Leaf412]KQT33370.1 hypothetical protein ASG29_04745 [Sphingomonas sp. Leaf412]
MERSPREALAALATAQGASLSAMSRMLGRNVAYLQQYVRRGTPRILPERDRALLAAYLGVDEAVLGGPAPAADDVTIPWLAVAAAAGSGVVAAEERVLRGLPLARATLRDLGVAPPDASVIAVAGDSMAPTLLDGDRVLVDRADRRIPAAGAVFVIRRDEVLSVKRLLAGGGSIRVVSDNPAFAAEVLSPHDVTVIGRARLLWRGL